MEHYCRCRMVVAAHRRFLQVHPDEGGSLICAWVLGGDAQTSDERTRMALGAYATYRAFNHHRVHGGQGEQQFFDMFSQLLKEGVMGHRPSEKALANTWAQRQPLRRPREGPPEEAPVRRQRRGDRQQ